ncbi:MAG: glycosyl hydrolase [Acidobacteriaceae bacterium]|nr:glycosyl hydrolase [Acidobacteriaceae bacterium]
MTTIRGALLLLLAGLASAQSPSTRPKALFYLTDNPLSVQSFLNHAAKIDILVPTWYSVDAAGLVWGGPNALVMETARRARVPVMPIVVNPAFNQENFHKFASAPDARRRFIQTLIEESKKHGYLGFQFDFENIALTDGGLLTALVTETAQAFHAEHLQLSIATVPNAPGYPGHGGFAKWIFENWRGAYDLKALSEQVDLICLMTYDEHTRYTPPGPVAGYPWTLENLDYALKVVPKEKLSLGIPVYGYRWFAGEPTRPGPNVEERPANSAETVGALAVQQLVAEYHAEIQWDPQDRVSWFYFYRDQTREWVFFTDARTFRERYNLVRERGIEGFCSWVLGEEDPAIWDLLPAH